jgi:hypothetical protein
VSFSIIYVFAVLMIIIFMRGAGKRKKDLYVRCDEDFEYLDFRKLNKEIENVENARSVNQ